MKRAGGALPASGKDSGTDSVRGDRNKDFPFLTLTAKSRIVESV